jgi:hypothetical protein
LWIEQANSQKAGTENQGLRAGRREERTTGVDGASIVVVVERGDELIDGLLGDTEQGGGLGLIVVALFEGVAEKALADLVEIFLDGKARGRFGQGGERTIVMEVLREKEVGGFEDVATSIEYRALEDVGEFANIAGPVVQFEMTKRIFGELTRALAALVNLLQKGEGQFGNFCTTIAESGKANLDNF